MLVIVSYDIENNRKRAQLARKLRDFGPRVQKSVFEADINEKEMEKLLKMIEEIKLKDSDSIRLYQVCVNCTQKIRIWGNGEVTKDKDYYIA